MFYIAEFSSEHTSAYKLVVGAALVLSVLFFPKGILGTVREKFAPWLP
jgi:branched-chain amino acid transport system permease protein